MRQETEKKFMFRHLAAAVCVFLAAISCIFSIAFDVDAAGSKNLTATQDPNTGTWNTNSGYRPYIEWNDLAMAGIVRQQIIKVYVNAGETLYFGSSVSNGIGGDIVVRKPDGSLVPAASLDVNSTTMAGYINTRTKELTGPNYPGSGKTDGYTPLSILVDQAGIWEFEFRTLDTVAANTNPPPDLLTASTVQLDAAGGVGVSAWDITVVAVDAAGVPTEVTGRVFANFLSLNTGNTFNGQDVVNSTVYVLTKDGYIYETKFNGMDPFGFIFFANNRGLVKNLDVPSESTSLYQSGIDSAVNNTMNSITSDGIAVQFHSPKLADTALDSTYKIFFEVPNNDLPASVKPIAYAPGTIDNFRFVGDITGHGFVGDGGDFYFNAHAVSSFQIKLDFTNYINESGVAENRGVVYLSNACLEGENIINWDGTDGNGNLVPAGNYGTDNGVVITVTAKAGEYHFPMLDVENNKNGIIIRMINDPVDAGNPPLAADDPQRTTVFYNNSFVTSAARTDIVDEYTALGTPALLNMLEGMSSMTGASKFGMTAPYSQGDFSAIDIWTYFKGGVNHLPVVLGDLVLEDPPDINGFVFYDGNQNGVYNASATEFPLSGITVNLSIRTNGNTYQFLKSTTTNDEGMYYFSDLANNDIRYRVTVESPYSYANSTTGSLTQQITLNGVPVTAASEGFYYPKAVRNITVIKEWAVDSNQDELQPDSVTVRVVGNYGTTTIITDSIVLSSANNWRYTFNDLPRYANGYWGTIVYTVSEDPVAGYEPESLAPVTTATDISYTFVNTPKCRIRLTKVDANDTSVRLSGAVFELYKRESIADTLITTATTDTDGEIYVTNLENGTYYFVETAAPAGYTLDPANTVTDDIFVESSAADYAKEITVTNEMKCNFTLTKTITQASQSDEQFLFEVTGPGGTYYAVITIAAGTVTASQAFVGMPAGTYSVVEKNSNWRYTLETDAAQADYTRATNGTDTYNFADNKLSMSIQNSQNPNYLFTFVDKKSIEQWVSGHSSVKNTMVIP